MARGNTEETEEGEVVTGPEFFLLEQAFSEEEFVRVTKAIDNVTSITKALYIMSVEMEDVGDKAGAKRLRGYAQDFAEHEIEVI